MRGLARYDLGETEAACMDFYQAIALGFKILEEAEGPKCTEIWKSYANE
jgi:hypothetical protein